MQSIDQRARGRERLTIFSPKFPPIPLSWNTGARLVCNLQETFLTRSFLSQHIMVSRKRYVFVTMWKYPSRRDGRWRYFFFVERNVSLLAFFSLTHQIGTIQTSAKRTSCLNLFGTWLFWKALEKALTLFWNVLSDGQVPQNFYHGFR